MHMFDLPPWMRKVLWVIGSAGAFVMVTYLRDLLTLVIHPYNIQLLNLTGHSVNALNTPSWGFANFDWVSLILTAIVIGLIASWKVNQAQNKIKEVESELKEAKARENQGLEKEISEWVEMCERLKNWLTPAIDQWEMQKRRGVRGNVTEDLGMTMMSQRKLDYDNAVQKLKEYDGANKLKKPREQMQSPPRNTDMVPISDELEKLIKPLYLSLDSNRENPIKGAHLAFGEIKQYGNLAQPELRKLLRQYCEIREENPKPEDRAPSYQMNHQKRLTDTIKQIFVLVEKRYKELMWGDDQS